MPSINFDLNDVKPLVSALGLGQAPSAAAPPVNALPVPAMPPGPPPPLPAQAGFGPWINDPQTLKKITDGITPPGQPILPAAQPAPGANLMPPAPGGAAPAAAAPGAPTPEQVMQTKMSADMAANPTLYQKPQLVGQGWKGALKFGIPAALMSLGSGLSNMGRGDPTAGMSLINAQAERDRGVPAANAAEFNLRNVQPLKDAAALADQQSLTAQRNAAAGKSDALADSITPFTMTKEQAAAINHPELAGTQSTMRDYNRALVGAGNNNTSSGNNANTNATKVMTTGMNNATSTGNNAANNARAQAIADAANKTKTLVAQMHDQTSRANNANTNDHKGMTGGDTGPDGMPIGNFKVPAMITNRASLAGNVLENAKAVTALIQKRPDILGSAGGRYTNIQQMIGSDDPDIQELGTRIHNIALASNGAHGTKGKGVLEGTETKIFNNFKTGPRGVQGALDGITGSMQSFLDDEKNFQTTGRRTGGNVYAPPAGGGGGSGGNSVTAPDGSVHNFANAAAAAQFKKAAGIK